MPRWVQSPKIGPIGHRERFVYMIENDNCVVQTEVHVRQTAIINRRRVLGHSLGLEPSHRVIGQPAAPSAAKDLIGARRNAKIRRQRRKLPERIGMVLDAARAVSVVKQCHFLPPRGHLKHRPRCHNAVPPDRATDLDRLEQETRICPLVT